MRSLSIVALLLAGVTSAAAQTGGGCWLPPPEYSKIQPIKVYHWRGDKYVREHFVWGAINVYHVSWQEARKRCEWNLPSPGLGGHLEACATPINERPWRESAAARTCTAVVPVAGSIAGYGKREEQCLYVHEVVGHCMNKWPRNHPGAR